MTAALLELNFKVILSEIQLVTSAKGGGHALGRYYVMTLSFHLWSSKDQRPKVAFDPNSFKSNIFQNIKGDPQTTGALIIKQPAILRKLALLLPIFIQEYLLSSATYIKGRETLELLLPLHEHAEGCFGCKWQYVGKQAAFAWFCNKISTLRVFFKSSLGDLSAEIDQQTVNVWGSHAV